MSSPYTVMIDGVAVQCDTPEAAIALVKAHGSGGGTGGAREAQGHSRAPVHAGNTRWTAPRVADFFETLDGKVKQSKLIDALLENEDPQTDDQLRQLLNLSSGMELAGVFAGLYKNAKKVGADPKELYVKKPITIGDKRGFEYTLTPGFRAAAAGRRAK